MRVSSQAVAVPGKGRSRNLIGVRRGRGRCLRVVMAHADTVARSPGGNDNASVLACSPSWPAHPRRGPRRASCGWSAPGPKSGTSPARATILVRSPWRASCDATAARRGCAGPCRWTRSDAGVARAALAGGRAAQWGGAVDGRGRAPRAVGLRWQRDASGGLSDHREFHLLGLRAMKLGPSASCYHQPCDTAGKLDRVALGRTCASRPGALAAR